MHHKVSVRMVEFKQELEDLLSEHQFISINLIASELNVHVNKGKFHPKIQCVTRDK